MIKISITVKARPALFGGREEPKITVFSLQLLFRA